VLACPQGAHEGQPVHPGHVLVGQDHVDRVLAELVDGVLPVDRLDDFMTRAAQGERHHLPDGRGVVDCKNGCHAFSVPWMRCQKRSMDPAPMPLWLTGPPRMPDRPGVSRGPASSSIRWAIVRSSESACSTNCVDMSWNCIALVAPRRAPRSAAACLATGVPAASR